MVKRMKFKRHRKRFTKRRRFHRKKRFTKKSKWDGVYFARCEQIGSLASTGTYDRLSIDWGTAPGLVVSVLNIQGTTEQAALNALFQEYKIVGFKVKINLMHRQVAAGVNATNAFTYAGIEQVGKGSNTGVTVIPTTYAALQKTYDFKELNPDKGVIKVWIGLSKYWKSILGQSWLPTNNIGGPGFVSYQSPHAGTVNMTTFGFQHTIPIGAEFARYTVYTYVKFRHLNV